MRFAACLRCSGSTGSSRSTEARRERDHGMRSAFAGLRPVARRFVQAHAAGLGARRREDAGLLVSELVMNALLQLRGAIALRIDRGVETCGSRLSTRATNDRRQLGAGRERRLGIARG
jgi:hypothetical protein